MALSVRQGVKPAHTTRSASKAVKVSSIAHARQLRTVQPVRGASVVVRAQEEDFDAILNGLAEKFEKSDNKPAIIGYSVGAGFALFAAEWLIHKPLLDVLLGFPIQLLGLLVLPYLGVRYFVEEKSATEDAKQAVTTVVKQLPGLGK